MVEHYVKLEDAARELNVSQDELKEMMEEGRIRHFMDSGQVKFRRKDLDALKGEMGISTGEEEAGAGGEEEDITLAPPEEVPEVPPGEGEEETAGEETAGAAAEEAEEPGGLEEEFEISALEEESGEARAQAMQVPGGAGAAAGVPEGEVEEEEEEIASLSDFEIGEEVEEEGEEISEEEAELISAETPGFRAYEEPVTASVGMTVLLILVAVVVAFGAMTLLFFAQGINPITSLTDMFVQ